MDGSFDGGAFAALQARLLPMWPTMTMRGRREQRTLVVLSSVSLDVPSQLHPLLPAYEERYLAYVLALASAPRTRVVYITSQPMLPQMLDYYLDLMPLCDRDDLRRRVVPVSVGDWSPQPLTQKILARPRLVERIRSLIEDPVRSVLLPFVTTELEARLAVALDIPVYGPHPDLAPLGTKSGSREVFAAAGVPHPRGAEHVRTTADVLAALSALGPVEGAIVKLDASVSGLGNAAVDLRGASGPAALEARVRALRPEDEELDPARFLALLEEGGGVVEERIAGAGFCSPSVQLRNSPEGGVEVLSTHDQLLGGRHGQTYFGCRFPADPAYATLITRDAVAIGEELARRGVIGRYAIDFVAVRDELASRWTTYAVEINLRNGGTTHPALTLLALTDGEFDVETSRFLVEGTPRHYVATDHLEVPNLRTLTPDDVLDVIEASQLGWDHETRSGLVFHMISGVAVAGRLGVTAVADSADGADALYGKVESALAAAAQP